MKIDVKVVSISNMNHTEIIGKIKKYIYIKYCVDCISNKLLKYVRNVISEPLTIIIHQMLNMGVFPDLLKISNVIPIYKKEDDTIFQITGLSHCCHPFLKSLKRLYWSSLQLT